jgi:hypothetical protein
MTKANYGFVHGILMCNYLRLLVQPRPIPGMRRLCQNCILIVMDDQFSVRKVVFAECIHKKESGICQSRPLEKTREPMFPPISCGPCGVGIGSGTDRSRDDRRRGGPPVTRTVGRAGVTLRTRSVWYTITSLARPMYAIFRPAVTIPPFTHGVSFADHPPDSKTTLTNTSVIFRRRAIPGTPAHSRPVGE